MNDKRLFVKEYIADARRLLEELDPAPITAAIMWLREARDADRTILICGNGGSASIASQMVVDVVKGASYGREKKFRILSLADSIATITAYANDVGYEHVFVEQLKNYSEPGNVLIAISGSGDSPNVIKAVEYANNAGFKTIGLTTSQGGKLRELSQLSLTVPSNHMGHLEDCFFIMTHILCYAFIEDKDF
ncbi:MAG: SIS domain-containing protein [Acidobacteriota bacterium]